jgi:hypothetical protein
VSSAAKNPHPHFPFSPPAPGRFIGPHKNCPSVLVLDLPRMVKGDGEIEVLTLLF